MTVEPIFIDFTLPIPFILLYNRAASGSLNPDSKKGLTYEYQHSLFR